ncbi:oligosaccharide flippase family protein [Litorilinea aerophila]|uniref:Oligosaccharide flippase family protein n=1 Tax=Litorilinea aerophila TaxID=1204385 RepID=A0A540VD66_9CHLR|nr:oligosaccharide flippase family protein [Litorilinea aerophila]MCC9077576.1 oligosaccharide flippase family protein [Litorilinea aerophila]
MNRDISLERRRFALNYGALFTGTAIARVLAGISLILVARQIGTAQFGQFTASLALTKITSVAFALGLEGWLLGNGFREGNHQLLSQRSTSVLLITTGFGLLWLGAYILIGHWLNPDIFPYSVVLLCALSVWFEEILNVVATTFKTALHNFITFWIITGSQFLLITLIFIQAISGQDQLLPFLQFRVLGMAFSAGVALLVMEKFISFRVARDEIINTLKACPPFALSLTLNLVYERIDVVIVGAWLGKELVGIYTPATTILIALFLIPGTLYGIISPLMSQLAVQSFVRLKRFFYRTLLGSAGLGFCLTLSLYFVAPHLILWLYGPDYQQAGVLLAVLSGVLFFRSLTFPLAAFLIAVRWQTKRLLPQTLSAATNLVLNLLIVQTRGVRGVAWVYVLSEAILMIGHLLLATVWLFKAREKGLRTL